MRAWTGIAALMRAWTGIAALLTGALLIGAPGAHAAVVVGQAQGFGTSNACVANFFWVQDSTEATGASYAIPDPGGVVTSWSTSVFAGTDPSATLTFKVLRKTADNTYLIVGSSPAVALSQPGSLMTFGTRIPAIAGDLLGFYVGDLPVDCVHLASGPADIAHNVGTAMDPPAGTTVIAANTANFLLNLRATVEPDADHDGFGDETQDQCPTDPTTHGTCVPPETTITKRPKNRTRKPTAKFGFVSSKAGSTFECLLKGRGLDPLVRHFHPCGSPRKYRNLDRGKYVFKVRATDAHGNIDPTPAKDKFKVVD